MGFLLCRVFPALWRKEGDSNPIKIAYSSAFLLSLCIFCVLSTKHNGLWHNILSRTARTSLWCPSGGHKKPLGPKAPGGQSIVIIKQKEPPTQWAALFVCNYFSLPSTASLRDLIAAWRKAGIGAPRAPAFSTILPSSVTIYHTSTTGPRNTE